MSKKIVLTGGGTAGHVTPNMALIPRLRELDYEITYMGSYDGIEKKLIEELGIPYYGISCGKFRRYFDPKNFTDPFKVLKGISEAKKLIKKIQPDVIFSKGGFVTVPVFCVILIGSEDTESYSFPFISSQNIVTDVVPSGIVISTSFPSFPSFPME